MLRFSLLGSGSAGNAMLVTSRNSKILVDCGLSFKQLNARSEAVGESLEGLQGVVVTHEHGDHVNGLGVLARKLGVPLYMSEGTRQNLPKSLGKISGLHAFESGHSFSIGDIELQSFAVNHDAADPVCYVLRSEGTQLGIATDLGTATNVVRHALKGSQALILESNYCPAMLRNSSYPPAIRERIGSRIGHLSNHDMSSLLSSLKHDELQLVILVHISQENNEETLARDLAAQALKDHSAKLIVAQQDSPTEVFGVRAGVTVTSA